MPLRNGKQYLLPWKCQKCNIFYGHKIYNYNCSHCSNNNLSLNSQINNEERKLALNKWIKTYSLDYNKASDKKILGLIKSITNNSILYKVLNGLRNIRLFLRSTDAINLINNRPYDNARCHIITAHVIDWWNIKTTRALGEWEDYLVCYYGNFDSQYLPKMPPRFPRTVLYCTSTSSILN